MNTEISGAAQATPSKQEHSAPRQSHLPLHVFVATLVAMSIVTLLVIAGWDVLRGATMVTVRPVVFDRSAGIVTSVGAAQADAPARRGQVVQAPGWLEADPFYIACSALADGVVDEMLALEGDRVEKGQIVARLIADDAELALARAEADQAAARAELSAAEADHAAALTNWENPVERERAVGAARAALAEAKAKLTQLPSLISVERAMLDRMTEELARARNAFRSGGTSDIELIIIEKGVEAQAASVEALRQREGILEANKARLETELKAAERNAELRVTEKRALDGANAAVARAKASIAQAKARLGEQQLRLDRMTIRAPISGFVQRRIKVPGDKVMLSMDDPLSSQLLHLYDPKSLQVRVDVSLADAAQVFTDQRCEVVVDVLPDETFAGVVSRITHEANIQKNTLQVKVRVIDPSPLLRPEMLTRVKFLPERSTDRNEKTGAEAAATTKRGAVLVPNGALQEHDSSTMTKVWAVRERRGDRGVVKLVQIEVIASEGGWSSVDGELRPGDLVVIDAPALAPGDRVRMIGGGS